MLAPQQTAERTTHNRPADRTADGAADRLSEIGHHTAYHLVSDRARNVAGDELAGRQPSTRRVGPEDGADDAADLTENAPAAAGCGRRNPLLQDLIGRFAIDRGIVFAFDGTCVDDGLALLGAHGPNPRRRRADHGAL